MSKRPESDRSYHRKIKELRDLVPGFDARDGYKLTEKVSKGQRSRINRVYQQIANDIYKSFVSDKVTPTLITRGSKVRGTKTFTAKIPNNVTNKLETVALEFPTRPLMKGERLREFQTFSHFTADEKKKYRFAFVYPRAGRESETMILYDDERRSGSRAYLLEQDTGQTFYNVPINPRRLLRADPVAVVKSAIEYYAPDGKYFIVETANGTAFGSQMMRGFVRQDGEINKAIGHMMTRYSAAVVGEDRAWQKWFVGVRAYVDAREARVYATGRELAKLEAQEIYRYKKRQARRRQPISR